MSAPQTGNKEFRDDVIRIAELTVTTTVLDGYTFQHCRIIGPAVLVPQGKTQIVHCNWGGGVDAIFWEVPPSRPIVVGAVLVLNCSFSGCSFEGIGLAGPAALRAVMEAGFSQQ